MNILTALKDGEVASGELWEIVAGVAREIVEKQGSNVLERFPVLKPGDQVVMLYQLVGLAQQADMLDELAEIKLLIGDLVLKAEDIPAALKELIQTNQQTVTLLNMIAEKIGVGPGDKEETDEEDV